MGATEELLIVTNFEGFPKTWTAADGTVGRSTVATKASDYAPFHDDPHAVFLVNCDPRLVMSLSARRMLRPGAGPAIVGVDLVLRQPRSVGQFVHAMGKSVLLKRVDFFIHYFKDTTDFDRTYRIPPGRAGFVPFKSNIWDLRAERPSPDGEYAICFGRSLRDYDTFFDAVERIGCPAAVVDPMQSVVWAHGSRFSRSVGDLPPTVRLLRDDMTNASQIQILSAAKLVVLPIVSGSLVASGISTILNAMALGKCVVASEGPGVSDIFTDELLVFPAEDPAALAEVLHRAWHDDDLRERTATAGWEYARRCGSEQDLFQRIIDELVTRREELVA